MSPEVREQLNDLRKRLSIDPFGLEDECVGQPMLCAEVGELATDARSVAKTAKENLDYVRADLSSRIRKKPDDYVSGKPTEASIEAAIILQKEYQEASANAIDCQRVADAFGVLQTAVEQRKSMIKDLVTMFVYNYYSSRAEMGGERRQVTGVEGEVTKEDIMNKRAENATRRGRGSGSEDAEVEIEQE